jgi:hypothetical protein
MTEDENEAYETPQTPVTPVAPAAPAAPEASVAPKTPVAPGTQDPDDKRPTLTAQVRRRRADQAFFLRLRDAIHQNHRALERIGT